MEEKKCASLYEELQLALVQSRENNEIIEGFLETNKDLATYIEKLEKAQSLQYQGKPVHDSSNEKITLRQFMNRANIALWFCKAFWIAIKSVIVLETESGREHHMVFKSTQATSPNTSSPSSTSTANTRNGRFQVSSRRRNSLFIG